MSWPNPFLSLLTCFTSLWELLVVTEIASVISHHKLNKEVFVIGFFFFFLGGGGYSKKNKKKTATVFLQQYCTTFGGPAGYREYFLTLAFEGALVEEGKRVLSWSVMVLLWLWEAFPINELWRLNPWFPSLSPTPAKLPTPLSAHKSSCFPASEKGQLLIYRDREGILRDWKISAENYKFHLHNGNWF